MDLPAFLLAGPGSVALAAGFYTTIVERQWLDICRVEVKHSLLPHAFDGMKIAHFSDVHWGFYLSYNFLQKAFDVIQQENPDMVCFTGDLIDSEKSLSTLPGLIPLLTKLHAPHGKYAVVGNHDYRAGLLPVVQTLQAGGFSVLQNDYHMVQKGKERLHIIGLDDVLEGTPNPKQAIAGISNEGFNLLLVHEPDYALKNHTFPFHLQLSGHSHGGQCRFPWMGPIITTHLGRKYHAGLNVCSDLQIYTNRGLGTTVLPIRFLCRPEITLLTLRRVE